MSLDAGRPAEPFLIGYLYRGGLEQWTYAIAADIAAQGALCMRFEARDVDFCRRLVHGEFWTGRGWERRWSRFPDVVRNFEFPAAGDEILDWVPYTLGRHLRKNEALVLLAAHPDTAPFVPASVDLTGRVEIAPYVADWGAAILKPARGRLGQGVVFVRKTSVGYDIEEEGQLRTVDAATGEAYFKQFPGAMGRDYVLQQFAAGVAHQGRCYNVRVIVQKSGDGDWHHCGHPLALISPSESVVVNRDRGATNVALRPILLRQFGDAAPQVLARLFSAAVVIARTVDDAIAQGADELALDMAIDDRGRPWLHEVNWRGGFWFLDEAVGLYRHGGANAVRMARRARGGVPDIAAAARFAAAHLRRRRPPPPDSRATLTIGAHLPRRADDLAFALAKLQAQRPSVLAFSASASYGAVLEQVGRAFAALREQAPGLVLPRLVASAGLCVHNPRDGRPPRRWMMDELVDPGYLDRRDLDIGSSLAPRFLERELLRLEQALESARMNVFVVEGVDRQMLHRPDWKKRWLGACEWLSLARLQGRIPAWGITLPWDWLTTQAHALPTLVEAAGDALPDVLIVDVPAALSERECAALARALEAADREIMIRVAEQPAQPKPWQARHAAISPTGFDTLQQSLVGRTATILCPIVGPHDTAAYAACAETLSDSPDPTASENATAMNHDTTIGRQSLRMLEDLGRFDPRQIFRFFVDGRFHKKYRGWRGYEENEAGSVAGMLNAYALMLERFDAAGKLTGPYLREIHLACMSNVATRNRKSTPGELRYLEAGIHLYRGNSTLSSLRELLEQRRGDGNWIFHTPGYRQTAEEFTAERILELLEKEGRLRYRMWYPNLDKEQQRKLDHPDTLAEFYEVKHFVQKRYAEEIDRIVARYNAEIAAAQTDRDRLIAISRVVRDLELLHPFPDGNGRTFVAVLMNHLLLYHGFLPAILRDPNIDAELSVAEFADEIERGMDNTRLLLDNPQAELYGYAIGQASQDETKEFLRLAQGFLTRLHDRIESATAANDTEGMHLHLTPQRLSAATGGVWFNPDPSLRFDHATIEATDAPAQLLFLRDLKTRIAEGRRPETDIARAIAAGTVAVVIDDSDIARQLPVPAYFVPDVDTALYDAATWVRRSVACQAVAVVGTAMQATTARLIEHAAKPQRRLLCGGGEPGKTPQIMATLASLRSDHQLALLSVATGARPNVARHRLRAIAPDICLFAACDNVENTDQPTFANILTTLAACCEGIRQGGLAIVNSACTVFPDLRREIEKVSSIPLQTYGERTVDEGRLLTAAFDAESGLTAVTASIVGRELTYHVRGNARETALCSVGALLVLENLGFDIEAAAATLALPINP